MGTVMIYKEGSLLQAPVQDQKLNENKGSPKENKATRNNSTR